MHRGTPSRTRPPHKIVARHVVILDRDFEDGLVVLHRHSEADSNQTGFSSFFICLDFDDVPMTSNTTMGSLDALPSNPLSMA